MKDEYAYVINTKVGGDMLTVRADAIEDVVKCLIELKLAYEQNFGAPEREVRTHVEDEPSVLSNCQQPATHGMKYARDGKRGQYCFECFKIKKAAEGDWGKR